MIATGNHGYLDSLRGAPPVWQSVLHVARRATWTEGSFAHQRHTQAFGAQGIRIPRRWIVRRTREAALGCASVRTGSEWHSSFIYFAVNETAPTRALTLKLLIMLSLRGPKGRGNLPAQCFHNAVHFDEWYQEIAASLRSSQWQKSKV